MKLPKLLSTIWAASGLKNSIPTNRTSSLSQGAATYAEGFPSITMTPIPQGGKAPSGKDMNGILNEITEHIVYQNKGGEYTFNSDFAETIGGYEKGAVLINDNYDKFFVSLIDNNKVNFNTTDYSKTWAVIATTDLINYVKPKDLDENSVSSQGADGHSHKLPLATLEKKGIVKLFSGTDSTNEDMAATPKAVNAAQTAADNANNNANGRVSKGGDVINGTLFIDGAVSGGFANGLSIRNKAGGMYTGGFIDFFQSDNVPRSSIWFRDVGNNSTQIEFLNTPEGADGAKDSRQGAFTISSAGNLWSKAYGWLHDYFAKQADISNVWNELNNNVTKRVDINNVWNELNNTYRKSRFRHQHYPNHYNGSEVYDIPMADNGVMRVIIMNVTINGTTKVNLPEVYNGFCMVQVTDVGAGRKTVGANIQDGNVIEIHNGGEAGFNILAIGWYGW